jgi:hypothetical protein
MTNVKAILFITFPFATLIANGQTDLKKIADSIACVIDKDTTLTAKLIKLDTLHYAYGSLVKTEVTFLAHTDPKVNHLRKVVWNNEGNYYSYVTIYYNNGAAIKGQIKAKYHRTDTNPEFETNSVFYYQNDKVVKEIELTEASYRANGFWYLNTITDFVTLAGLELK